MNRLDLSKKWMVVAMMLATAFLLVACESEPDKTVITFETHGGREVDPIEKEPGEMILSPGAYKEGYRLEGWYESEHYETGYNFHIMPEEDLTLHAKWEPATYTVNYRIYEAFHPFEGLVDENGTFELGTYHGVLLSNDNHVYTWGSNRHQQLGDGSGQSRSIPEDITRHFELSGEDELVDVDLGDRFTAALSAEGRLFTWGDNDYATLGNGNLETEPRPEEITEHFNLNDGERIIGFSVGSTNSLVLTNEDSVYAWGQNQFGQVGDGSVESRTAPVEITTQFEFEDDETVKQMDADGGASALLTSNGRLYMWGVNTDGKLGDGTSERRLEPVEITSFFDLSEGETIDKVALGKVSSMALTSDGHVYTWGNNNVGTIGDGTREHRLTPTNITDQFDLGSDAVIEEIAMGSKIGSALSSDEHLYMWGLNSSGALGIGSDDNSKTTPQDITSQFDFNEDETITHINIGDEPTSSIITSEGNLYVWGLNYENIIGHVNYQSIRKPSLHTSYSLLETISQNFEYKEFLDTWEPDAKEGYTFDGWYTDQAFETPLDLKSMPAGSFFVHGRFLEE